MKQLKLLILLTLGVMASSSGMIQVGAALYTFSVDFSTKEVANFNNFKQSFISDTYGLKARLVSTFSGSYKMDSCPTAFTINVFYEHLIRINGVGSSIGGALNQLPDFPCRTTLGTYNSLVITDPLPSAVIDALMNDDADFIRISATYYFTNSGATNGRTLELSNWVVNHTIEYDFNTTYLFNYFLSDTRFNARTTNAVGTWTFRSDPYTKVNYLFTTAGADEFRIVNTDFLANLGTTRKKYAVDYNNQFFRGRSIGANISRNYITDAPFNTDTLLMTNSGTSQLIHQYDYYYLNSANLAQAIVTAPVISFTQESCSGGFLDLNVGCYVNNAIAYLVNDAPVISDAFTLLNTGIELAAQTFGIIGSFTDDNVFGYLILLGFGFIAVKWFLKNDE